MTRYLLVGILALPAAAFGQARSPAPYPSFSRAPQDRGRLSINAGLESASGFTSTTATPLYLETETINSSYSIPPGVFVDGEVIVRVRRRGFAVGAAVSTFTKSDAASVTGSIPHPFLFNTPRAISGTTSPLERSETAVHMLAAFISTSKRRDIVIAGGPSFFHVTQDLVGDVTYTEGYPYDTAVFSGATASKSSASSVGLNVGVDVGVKLSKSFGVGGLVRYSRAGLTLPLAKTTSGVSIDAGGVQAGGGVRLYF